MISTFLNLFSISPSLCLLWQMQLNETLYFFPPRFSTGFCAASADEGSTHFANEQVTTSLSLSCSLLISNVRFYQHNLLLSFIEFSLLLTIISTGSQRPFTLLIFSSTGTPEFLVFILWLSALKNCLFTLGFLKSRTSLSPSLQTGLVSFESRH